jgi:hypothetical protein
MPAGQAWPRKVPEAARCYRIEVRKTWGCALPLEAAVDTIAARNRTPVTNAHPAMVAARRTPLASRCGVCPPTACRSDQEHQREHHRFRRGANSARKMPHRFEQELAHFSWFLRLVVQGRATAFPKLSRSSPISGEPLQLAASASPSRIFDFSFEMYRCRCSLS